MRSLKQYRVESAIERYETSQAARAQRLAEWNAKNIIKEEASEDLTRADVVKVILGALVATPIVYASIVSIIIILG